MERLTQIQNKTAANISNFGYDTTDQLVSEISTETPTPQLSQSYSYDAMVNRTGGTQGAGAGATQASYQSNKLNQYATINAVWDNGTSTSLTTLSYDRSGNLTQMNGAGTSGSSQTQYSYDDADRLTSVVKKDGAGANDHKSEYVYDGISRLRISREYSWVNGAWVLVTGSEKHRVYDGMNVVQERGADNAVLAFYTRGSDMGGGIGGLLSRSTAAGHFYYHYDGRGNVVQMTDSTQATVASYKY